MRTLPALLCLALAPSLLGAQRREPGRSDDGPLVSRGDAVIGAGFILGSAALWPVDRYLATRIQDSTVQAVRVASDAFAAATVFTAEAARAWPGREWALGPVLCGSAAMVGVSRMYDDKHWATDVLAGAALGTLVGLQVVRFHGRGDDGDDDVVPDGGSPGATVSLALSGGGLPLGVGPGW
ncbi:MAG TPA: phosphatase PAP2 family protein [Longimicrobiaceae bacterium]|nr:phosphatase PAP2 family protein [Longimicrobiaceae bacterium]